jgi:hypothetical protein
LTLFQDKLSQASSIKQAWIFAKLLQQVPDRQAVVVEGSITGSTILAHPLTECGEENWIWNRCLTNDSGDCAYTSQAFQEQTHTIEQLQPMSMAVTRTLASVQMVIEALNQLLGQT